MSYAKDDLSYTDREILLQSELDIDAIPAHSLKEILGAMKQGQKISAIKLYREVTGVGLAEAKQAVESLGIRPVETAGIGQGDVVEEPVTVSMGNSNSLLFFVVLAAVAGLVWLLVF